MEKERYGDLLRKLDNFLIKERVCLLIKKDTELENLSKNQLFMTHTLLHKFYPSKNKILSKVDIEELHSEIRKLIGHHNFDTLDTIK